MEKYSVLMSLYRKENPEYLRQALDSMLAQTALPDEMVLVEDGPLTKALYDVLSEYEKHSPVPLRRVRSEKNIGLGLALNLGLAHCRNELVARMDTDDIALPRRCEKQLQRFAEKPELALLGAWVDEFSASPDQVISTRAVPLSHEEIYAFAKRRSAFNHPAVMYRKSAVQAQGGYGDLRRNQDVDLFGRMLYAGCRAENIGESLLYFRCNADLARRRRSWINTKSYIQTIRRFWKMGYASFLDYAIVAAAQTVMFLCPVGVQQWLYKTFLRK